MELDRRKFIAALGGAAAVAAMSHEARADALEDALIAQLDPGAAGTAGNAGAGAGFPTAAEVEATITTRPYRRGVGNLFLDTTGANVTRLPAMPEAPTLLDFFEHRFTRTRNHCFQSANKARERGADEEIVLACLLHDVVQEIMKTDHGYWGAQLFEPYVRERTAFAIRYHQALRCYPDEAAGYHYPDLYYRIFGEDYVPPPPVAAAYAYASTRRCSDAAREVTCSDPSAFDSNVVVSLDPLLCLIGRHFQQPQEGLGTDTSPAAPMSRTIANPDSPLQSA